MNEQTINDALALQRQSTQILISQFQSAASQLQDMDAKIKAGESALAEAKAKIIALEAEIAKQEAVIASLANTSPKKGK